MIYDNSVQSNKLIREGTGGKLKVVFKNNKPFPQDLLPGPELYYQIGKFLIKKSDHSFKNNNEKVNK